MATGNTLLTFESLAVSQPATNYATFDTRNTHPVYEFDADTDETLYFEGIMPRHYAAGGVTVYIHWLSDTQTSGNVRWDAGFEALAAQDYDADGFAAVQSATGAANGTCGVATVTSIAFTDGAQMDSVAAGGKFRLKITRDANHATDDTMTGDAQLVGLEIKET